MEKVLQQNSYLRFLKSVIPKMGYRESDKRTIKRFSDRLESSIQNRFNEKSYTQIMNALELAANAHRDDRRKTGDPYITHPIEVAIIVANEMGLGPTAITCALLHDVVEDTDITLEQIETQFGNKVAAIINGLTKISGVVGVTSSGSLQAENFKKILLTISDDIRVILIKLADRLHNMRTLDSMREEKQLKIASETLFLYAPLAHRLGFYNIKSEMEDLGLKFTEPQIFSNINKRLKETRTARNKYIAEFMSPIKRALDEQGIKYEIKGRTKHIYSIWNKMVGKKVTFDEVYDLFAIRIILESEYQEEKADCWRVYSVVTDFYKPKPERLKDFISNPKVNGYESLHTTVMGPKGRWVEVQIRTKRMDEIAEKGLAAHWKYKEGSQVSAVDEWISHIRELISNPETDTTAIDFVNSFKSELFDDEIYTFSPKGDLYMLPNGATSLDFAFSVHTQVGSNCIGAKVNHKLVPLNHLLQNGDQVEIITSKKQKPNEDWLSFVKTSKAKSKIRSALKEERRKIADQGKESLLRKLKALKVPPSHENLNEIATFFELQTILDLHYEIAKQRVDLSELKRFTTKGKKLLAPQSKSSPTIAKEVTFSGNVREYLQNDAELLIMGNAGNKIEYSYANCCKPIPGDNVFGFISVSDGIKIHRTNCPNAVQLMSKYGYRIIKVKWTSKENLAFLSGIKISGIDDVGLVNKITKVISGKMQLNIQSLTIDTKNGVFEGIVNLFVNSTKELDDLIIRLRRIDGIMDVKRV